MWYTDATLKSMKKDNLIGIIRCLEHNLSVAEERNSNQFRILMEHEKYRWHDLRKNPEDLPENFMPVEIIEKGMLFERDFCYWDEKWYRQNYPTIYHPNVIKWRYIEPYEEVEV